MDDAYALALAVFAVFPEVGGEKPRGERLAWATRVYERVRRPHTSRLLEVVRGMGEVGRERLRRGEREREGDGELRARMRGRADASWLHEYDVEGAFRAVVGGEGEGGGREGPRL